ncbi:MAG: hypothetical protein H6732_13035 [Alphaproteobacteria bacterium]|nr:hypothetical protein [Alphaproteobacteria bacterium]
MPDSTTTASPWLRDLLAATSQAIVPDDPDFGAFTPWTVLMATTTLTPVREGRAYDLAQFAGVYLVAWFGDDVPPAGPADPFDRHVVYIGRTRTRPIAARWANLLAGIGTGSGHSGGNTLHEELHRVGLLETGASGRFHVAALPVWVTGTAPDPTTGRPAQADARQLCFRTAALEALLIEAVSDLRRRKQLPALANEPSLLEDPTTAFRLVRPES